MFGWSDDTWDAIREVAETCARLRAWSARTLGAYAGVVPPESDAFYAGPGGVTVGPVVMVRCLETEHWLEGGG